MTRRLFGFERLLGLVSGREVDNGFGCFRVRGAIREEQLRAAIDKLQRRHPLLRARLSRAQGELVLTTQGVPPIALQVERGGQSFARVAAIDILRRFDMDVGPLVRFAMVCDPQGDTTDILMIGHHLVGDGVSFAILVRDLLTFIQHPAREIEPLPMPPPLIDLLPESLVRSPPPPTAPVPSSPPRVEFTSPPSPGFEIIPASLPPDVTEALAVRCKQHGVSVHALLCTCFASQIAANREPSTVVVSSPLNFRPRLRRDVGDACGLFMTMVDVGIDFSSPRTLWERAHSFQAAFAAQRTDERLFGPLLALDAMLRSLPSEEALFQQMSLFERRHDISISNPGKFPFPTRYGDLLLESVHGVACAPGEVVVSVFGVNGALWFTLGARELSPFVVAKAKQVFSAALEAITRLACST